MTVCFVWCLSPFLVYKSFQSKDHFSLTFFSPAYSQCLACTSLVSLKYLYTTDLPYIKTFDMSTEKHPSYYWGLFPILQTDLYVSHTIYVHQPTGNNTKRSMLTSKSFKMFQIMFFCLLCCAAHTLCRSFRGITK